MWLTWWAQGNTKWGGSTQDTAGHTDKEIKSKGIKIGPCLKLVMEQGAIQNIIKGAGEHDLNYQIRADTKFHLYSS